jgi:translation initiation factor 2 subunit 3
MSNITIDKQPFITISTLGQVANGKTSLIKKLSGTNPMKFKKEAQKDMTIKLGYTNCKFYKCLKCPSPYCYQNTEFCEQCDTHNVLVLHVSFVDSPGHSDLQTTALSGASNVDFSLLVIAANCREDPESNEHYKTNKILGLNDKTFIIHNKIDLVNREQAYEHYDKLREKYDIKYIIPLCAQFGFGLNYLIQFLVERIPNPINENFLNKIKLPLKASIIRSFDVNKVGSLINNLVGAIVGGTIKTGSIKIGDKIKIVPGIIQGDSSIPLFASVVSLKTENTVLDIAYPGGLIGIGLSLDPSLSKEDKLVGNFILAYDDNTYKTFKKAKISYNLYDLSCTLKSGDNCILMMGSTKRNIKIILIDTNKKQLTFETNIVIAGYENDSVVITKNNKILIYGNILDILNS